MDLLIQKIEGKPITRFPVYLEKKGEPRNVQVAVHLNDVARLMKDGSTWINRGPAPYDRNRAVLNSKPSSSISVTKTFEVFRVTEIIGTGKHTDRGYYEKGMTLHLFPKGKFSPSSAWTMENRPRAGGYILRHDDDYYTYISDKLFDRQYAPSLDAETLAKFKDCLNPVSKAKHGKQAQAVKAEAPVSVDSAPAVEEEYVVETTVLETTDEAQDVVSEDTEVVSGSVEE